MQTWESRRILKENEKIMKMIFPKWETYPGNILIPCIGRYDNPEEPTAIHLMFKGEHSTLRYFIKEKNNVLIETRLDTEDDGQGDKNLVIEFKFFYSTGNPVLKACIEGHNRETQKYFIESLKQIDSFYLWITDVFGNLVKVKGIPWDYETFRKVLDPLR